MPYYESGSLTTDERTINDSGGWDSQSEWGAFQSASQVEIVDGTVQLSETATGSVEMWDSYSTGTVAPGEWINVAGTDASQVTDAQAYSSSNSYLIEGALADGASYIRWDMTPGQYGFAFDYRIFDDSSESNRGAVRFNNESGDPVLYMGTNSPGIHAEGATTVEVHGGMPDSWQGLRAVFDWASATATVSYWDPDFNSQLGSAAVDLKAVSPLNLASVGFAYGGQSSAWGGSGDTEVYWDNCTVVGGQ